MITNEALYPLIEAVPGFSESWSRFLQEWEGDEPMPWYNGMAELAHHLVDSYSQNSIAELPEFFRAVEAAFQNADDELHGLLAVGLFEDLQAIASHRPFGSSVFKQWLGPESLAAWSEVQAGLRKVAPWSASRYRQHSWQFWRPKPFNAARALSKVQSPELRKMLEATYPKRP